jgi:hypothetical protein
LFGRTFQTDEFDGTSSSPQKVRDTIRVRSPTKEAMLRALGSDDALTVALCTQGAVLATLAVPIWSGGAGTSSSSRSSSGNSSSGSSGGGGDRVGEVVVENHTAWHTLAASDEEDCGAPDAPAVKITASVSIEDVPKASAMPRIREERGAALGGGGGGDDDYADDDFDDDDDGDDGRAPAHPPKGVRFSGEGALGRRKASDSDAHHRADTSRDDTSGEDDDADDFSRHYRMTVDVRSIGGLARAANASIKFAYPYLGSSRPVLTHPLWLPANTEEKLDGGAATFDCVMSRNRLRDVFAEHPLKVSAMSRTHMGSSNIGDVVVDLFGVIERPPHSYRCPITNKMFKSLEEYATHRQGLAALRGLNQVEQVPPKDPVTIWAQDVYYPLGAGAAAPAAGNDDASDLGGRLRVVVIVEELGVVGSAMAVPVKVGYKMHNGALYAMPTEDGGRAAAAHPPAAGRNAAPPGGDPSARRDLSAGERLHLEKLKADWEAFRLKSEAAWRDALREKEREMRSRLEAEAARSVAERADDLRRAQEEAGRLEVRLRGAIDEAERQKAKLKAKDEQAQAKLAQKAAELQLLQRRVRDEAKARIDAETQRADGLQTQLTQQKQHAERLEKRLRDSEREFEAFRAHARGTPEALLREEGARLRAQLGECRAEVERERRVRAEAELEKEHFRAQMHRLALALKRERERSAASARQDLEQLRLEFLAREERYVLDGDREELRNIRHELASLRTATLTAPAPAQARAGGLLPPPPPSAAGAGTGAGQDPRAAAATARRQLEELLSTGLYAPDSDDPVISALRGEVSRAEAAAAAADAH